MGTSKIVNNRLAVKLATDSRYRFQKNGVVKKIGSDGKFRVVGTERHGYNVVTYLGTKIVVARVYAAQEMLEVGFTPDGAAIALKNFVVERVNGISLDDRKTNLYVARPSEIKREDTKRLTQKQIDRMVELFFDGFSVAKIARRFHRKISRSHVSRIIRRELNLETVGA